MKKSQMPSQIFIYVLAIIIIGVILLVGYNAITDVLKRMNQISEVQFKEDLTAAINRVKPNFGREEKREFEVPKEYNEMCFADNVDYGSLVNNGHSGIPQYAVLDDAISTNKNVFLLKNTHQIGQPLEIKKIRVGWDSTTIPHGTPVDQQFDTPQPPDPDGYLVKMRCLEIKGGRLSIDIIGKGNYVIIHKRQ